MDMHCKADPFSAMHREYWSPAPSAAVPFSSLHSSFPNHPSSPDPPSGPPFHPGRYRAYRGVQKAGRILPARAAERGCRAAPRPRGAEFRAGTGAGARTPSPRAGDCVRLCLRCVPCVCEGKAPLNQLYPPQIHFPHRPSDNKSLFGLVSVPGTGPFPVRAQPGRDSPQPSAALTPQISPRADAVCFDFGFQWQRGKTPVSN